MTYLFDIKDDYLMSITIIVIKIIYIYLSFKNKKISGDQKVSIIVSIN